ncbi:DUF4192 family protein [Streptomyces sp. NPDC048290]|uniref:DUF4192 domain-containing protein n=1 Tax=Streptomyces sp. NPDC048290 TaxID=3155811 RepID=UPI0034171D9C
MTNHSESTGSFDHDDTNASSFIDGTISDDTIDDQATHGYAVDGRAANDRAGRDRKQSGQQGDEPRETGSGISAYDGHGDTQRVTLRSPGELADALPYLLGYRPEDSIVLVSLHNKDGRGRLGGRARLGIPTNPDDWPSVAKQLAHGLVTGSRRRGSSPEQMVAYVCQEPAPGETGLDVRNRLYGLAQHLRVECGLLDVPVIEALCISGGRFWSYCCSRPDCCPPEGVAMGLPGTSVLAAAATYAGFQVRGTLRELRARLMPMETASALEQEIALDKAGMSMVPRILDANNRAAVATETVELAERVMRRLADAPKVPGPLPADLRDDTLLTHDEAASLILGLQDRTTRDQVAEWMEGDVAAPALRLWRALARRCVGPYTEHAAAPLTLAGWVAWSTGDDLEAREALAMALGADTEYLFARLLHQAVNEGLDPEAIRRCLRSERAGRTTRDQRKPQSDGARTGDSATPETASSGGGSPTADTESEVCLPPSAEVPEAHMPAQRRRRPRSATGGSSASCTASPEGRPTGTRRTPPAPDRTRPAAARPSGTCSHRTAREPLGTPLAPADGAQTGNDGTDAEE